MTQINCPRCGKTLLKGESGVGVQIKCFKCKTVYSASFKDTDVRLEERKAGSAGKI